jgi:ABC-2 type transport system permease protein/lipopolysaccharide transport system permease protein
MTDAAAEGVALPRASAAPARAAGGLGRDFYAGLRAWRIWGKLAWNDIQQRYRRSVLGPFWMTLSMGVMVLAIGTLYSRIFHQDVRSFLPFVALGIIAWTFLAMTLTETCAAFTEGEAIIKQMRVPFSLFVLRGCWRNFIVFLHTVILIVPIWIVLGIAPRPVALLALPGLALFLANLVWMGIVVAIFATRFRDVPLMVQTVLQIGMFATPIMWPVETLGDDRLVADINPAYHLTELVRAPLLGQAPAPLSWEVCIGMVVVGGLFAALLLRRSERRIVYWL